MEEKKTFAVQTLGCKVNQAESETILKNFLNSGLRLVSFPKKADVYVVNTCSVTREAEAKSRKFINRISQNFPGSSVVVTGCYVERAPHDILNLPQVDFLVSNDEKDQILEKIFQQQIVKPKSQFSTSSNNNLVFERAEQVEKQKFHTRALVKIQDGCGNFCSYCIVPYVRGKPRSRKPQEILTEILRLVSTGVKEIVLTGVNLGKYGINFLPKRNLALLLKEILKVPGLKRIRLSSLNVEDLDLKLLKLLSDKKICPHFHLPLQSGSNKILKKMNRNYTAEEYLEVTEKIKEKIPQAALTTDLMVGFPGETEKDFDQTLSLVKELGFRKTHVFKFSPRPKTLAATFKEQLQPRAKEARAAELIKLGQCLSQRFLENFIGKELQVVVEAKKNGLLTGLSPNYLRIFFEGQETLVGELVKVKALRMKNGSLYGKIT